jgi:hypothetical protein
VIGAGHNGLTHAAYLARAGRRVLVLERRGVVGGRRSPRRSSGLPGLRVLVRRLAAAAGDHPRARSRAARARDPAARRDVHADAGRRLPLARERPRAHAPRDRAALARRRRGLRRVRARHDRHGAVRQADPRPHACRSALAPSARPEAARLPRATVPEARARRPLQHRPVDDDERGRFPRRLVRDRRAQGHDGRVGHHRHVPRRAIAGHGVRAAPPLHGRDRRGVPLVGLRARWHGRHLAGDCVGGARRGRGDQDGGGRRADTRRERPRGGCRARGWRGDSRGRGLVVRRSAADVPGPARRRAPAGRVRGGLRTTATAARPAR